MGAQGGGAIAAAAGPEALELRSDVPLQTTISETAEFTVAAGQRVGSCSPALLLGPRHQPSTHG